MTARARRKEDFSDPQRLHLVELDLDAHDELFDEIRQELSRIKGILLGVLVSTTTAALLLAATAVIGR